MAKYDASSIQVLEGLEAVRTRPGMYVSDTGKAGFHHLLWECLDNAVDEAMGKHADRITVTVENSQRPRAVVEDNGRGIPFDKHASGVSALEVIFMTLHSGGKFGGGGYVVSGGLHGVGAAVVNALSSLTCVTSWRGGLRYEQQFSRGKVHVKGKETKIAAKDHGTMVRFYPDEQIFGEQQFDYELVRERVRTKAYLTPGVRFILITDGPVHAEEFCYRGGLADLIAGRMNDEKLVPVTDFPFVFSNERLQVALTWTMDARTADELIDGFANGIPTRDGGTHVSGLKSVVSEVVREYISSNGLAPKRPQIEPEDVREGLVGAIHVLIENPQFQGQTKDRLNNPEVKGMVVGEVRKALTLWLNQNREQSRKLAERVVEAARARTASRSAVVEVRRKSVVTKSVLPGKLADCSEENPMLTELFLVEGDSAGGSGKQARNRNTQAILPLRGKILNVMEKDLRKMESNEEISNLILALGCGLGSEFDIADLRYGKIILMTDADVDGHHIACLLIAFFYKAMPGLIRAGRLFLACPPLYRINVGKDTLWACDDDERDEMLRALGKKAQETAEVSYFKGLGEMPPDMLFSTTMNPKTRRLIRIDIPDGMELETAAMMHDLMGGDVEMRLPWILSADTTNLDT